MLTPDQYFREALKASDIETLNVDEQLEKIAEESGRPLELVKLAKRFFDDSILEGLDYESREARWEDAVKIAEGYEAYITEEKKNATKTVDRLLNKLAGVAREYAEDLGLAADPLNLIKLAALQADSVAEYNEKVALLNQEINSGTEEAGEKVAEEAVVEELPDYFHRADNEKTAGLIDLGAGAKRLLEDN